MSDNAHVLPDPREDGKTHINVYSRGASWLGQQLSNMSYYDFAHPRYGVFASLEGFWYWLSTGKQHEELRKLAGVKAKMTGREFETIPNENFEEEFKEAMRLRLEQHPIIANALAESLLPLKHYYCYGGKVVDLYDRHKWQMDFYEEWRKANAPEDTTLVLLISGSRKEKDYDAFKHIVMTYLQPYIDKIKDTYKITLLSGLAWEGPDDMAIRLCREEGFMLIGLPAKWKEQGKAAGMIRNGAMGRLCNKALVFWDGESPGTKGMIDYLKKNTIDHLVYLHGKHEPDWKAPETS
ncbi:hypothetical protein REBECCA_154 [Erwinia phage Rebecca]|uniref:DUF2493 domain-containing protein n=2 Tax=Agricanvirus TaxID=1984776 RepID=A0A191ZC55_9CAUD|nr:hypothetical protein FDI00_gp155 [Erwinia phage vB_EamM_Special G]ANJ64965.1 hypothetical protein SPECIALG_155 [Erwinia phage vB_EamM_Special G]QBP07261.1 hypothetical protein REBECCA_154 [Erwinia phage Rebecca]